MEMNGKQIVCKWVFYILAIMTILNYFLKLAQGIVSFEGTLDCVGEIAIWWVITWVLIKVFKDKPKEKEGTEE